MGRLILVIGLCAGLCACDDSGDSTDDTSGDGAEELSQEDTATTKRPKPPPDRLPISEECRKDPCCLQNTNYDPAMCDNPFGVGEDAGTEQAEDAGAED